MTLEQEIARAITGQDKPSALMNDAYGFSMAQAGFALRDETFVLSFRRGGPCYIPFDLNALVQALLPALPTTKEAGFLAANGYPMTTAMEKALQGSVRVVCAPKGAWVGETEPILTVTGPSFLASWLGLLLIMVQYPIQVATALKRGKKGLFVVTCEDEARIVLLMLDAMQSRESIVQIDTQGYLDRVRKNVRAVVDALGGDAHRAFEVGLRAATCMQQHLMVLDVCQSLGVRKTSNVYGAWLKYMVPVGTTGHEHQMRWGGENGDDRNGFRAIRDMRPETPSYLFDTVDPIRKGIPAAMDVMDEDPDRACTLRFDSGDQDAQFLAIEAGCKAARLQPTLIFEDGYNAEKTARCESFCDARGWPEERRMYGFGGFWVSQPADTPYNRDHVSAAYKLSCTGGRSVMKFSGSPGKASIPGKPRIVVRSWAKDCNIHVIAQEGEMVPDCGPLGHSFEDPAVIQTEFSPLTKALRARLALNAGRTENF